MKNTILSLVALVVIVSFHSPDAHSKTETQWNAKMAELSNLFSTLLPLAANPSEFFNPGNGREIEKKTKRLAELAHGLDAKKMTADSDPTVGMIALLFETEANRAHREFKRGNKDYARSVVLTLSGYCIGCHSRGNFGKQFASFDNDARLRRLPLVEQAKLFAATRRFDDALNKYEEAVNSRRLAKTRPLEWENATRTAMAIAIRVKNNPDIALRITNRVISMRSAASFVKEDAKAWKKAIQEWKKEPKRTAMTEEGYFAEANILMKSAIENQRYPAEHSTDVNILRASATLHELLKTYPKGKRVAEALFLLGVSYQILGDFGLWFLHELFFKACIQKKPKSDISKSCYRKYEESVYLGYSGSGGVSIPNDARTELNRLKKMAGL